MSAIDDLMADPRALNRWGTSTDAGGELIGAIGHIQYGIQAQQAAEFQAEQLAQNANTAAASGQRRAADVDRTSKILASNALATAAASGGGASDPGVVNIIANVAAEGAYRKTVALYEGDDKARALNLAADTKRYEGKAAKANAILPAAASVYRAGTTLLQGGARDASLYQRFGMGGPAPVNDAWAISGPGE